MTLFQQVVEHSFYRSFEQRLCKRIYPLALVRKILAEVKFTYRKEALCNSATKTKKRDSTVCNHLHSSNAESQKDSHETLAHYSTTT